MLRPQNTRHQQPVLRCEGFPGFSAVFHPHLRSDWRRPYRYGHQRPAGKFALQVLTKKGASSGQTSCLIAHGVKLPLKAPEAATGIPKLDVKINIPIHFHSYAHFFANTVQVLQVYWIWELKPEPEVLQNATPLCSFPDEIFGRHSSCKVKVITCSLLGGVTMENQSWSKPYTAWVKQASIWQGSTWK